MAYKVIWDNIAKEQLKKAYSYIKKDSVVNAEKIRKEILLTCNELNRHPKKHPADKYKIVNYGSYRTFILHRYRISYVVKETEIIVLQLRHTSREPLEY